MKHNSFRWLISKGIGASLLPLEDTAKWIREELSEEKKSWKRFRRVVYALYLRQLQQQLGGELTGFVWLLLEPLIMILLFTMMHAMIGGSTSQSDYIIFMGSGLIPFFLFRTILSSSTRVFKQNKSLYHYSQLIPFDTFIANVLFETSRYAIVTLILLLMAYLSGLDVVPKDFDLYLVGVLWLILFSMSFGLLFGVLTLFYEVVARLVSFLTLPLLILSGVFFSLNTLPPIIRESLLYNPLLHFMELLHGSYMENLTTQYVSYSYITLWTVIPLFLGLWLYKSSEWKFIA